MSSSSELGSRRASVLLAARPTTRPAFPDLSTPESSSRTRADLVDHRAEAWQSGYSDGYASGQAEATAAAELQLRQLADARASVAQLLAALPDAVAEVRGRQAVALDETARVVAEAALSLAEAVIGRAVPTGADALCRALALCPSGGAPVARLHPDDLDGLDVPDGVQVIADAGIERGGCVVDVDETSIDSQIGPALARARAVLLGESEEAW